MRRFTSLNGFTRNAALATAILTLGGCVSVPGEVGDYSYEDLERIGAIEEDRSCERLRDKHANDKKWTEVSVKRAVESCKATAQVAEYRYEYRERKKEEKQAKIEREQERVEAAEQNDAYRAEIRDLDKRRAAAYQESRQIIKDRINETQVAQQLSASLDDALVNNQMAVSPGFPLPDLKRVLACAEMEFEVKTVKVSQSGRDLSVFYKDAMTDSGAIDITMNFQETSEFWLMTNYVVGAWKLDSNLDKGQMIVKMNSAKPCNALDVMETVMAEDQEKT